MIRRRTRLAVIALAATAIHPSLSRANKWNAPVSGVYSDPTNWDSSGVPGTSGLAQFNTRTSAGYTVSLTAPTTLGTFEVDNDTLTLDLNGNTFDTGLTLGPRGTSANLTVTGGGTLSGHGAIGIGASSGGSSSLTLDGSSLSLNDFLYVAETGAGSLTLENSASVTLAGWLTIGSTGSTAAVGSVSASNSSITAGGLLLGSNGSSLSLSSGATFHSTSFSTIAYNSSVTVDGAGTTFTNDNNFDFHIDGSVTVQNKATASQANGSVAVGTYSHTAPASLTVTGAGSQFTVTGSTLPALYVAQGSNASLTVSAGATLSDGRGVLGATAGSSATAVIDGAGTTWANSSDLYVGSSGNASLTISNGAAVTAGADGSTSQIAQNAAVTGSVTVTGAGSKLSVTNNAGGGGLTVGNAGAASLTVQNGGALVTNLAAIASAASSTSTATIDGANSSWTAQNGITVGSSGNGSLTISNNALVTSGGNINLATGATGTGTLTIQGAGSSLAAPNLYVAGSSTAAKGTGVVNHSGGSVTVSGTLKLWNTPNSAYNLSGGSLKVGTLDLSSVANTSRLNWTGGSLEISASSPTLGFAAGGVGGNLPPNLTLSSGMTLKVSQSSNTFTIATNASGSADTFTVDGGAVTANATGSKVNIGTFAAAGSYVNVTNSGTFSSLAVNIGTASNGYGSVSVQNSGKWTAGGIVTVGSGSGNGTLGLYTAGTLSATELDISTGGGIGNVYVDGTGSKLTSSGPLYAAKASNATGNLTLTNAGQVANTDGYLGYTAASSTASAQVSGTNSSWASSGSLYVGYSGNGTLSIDSGGSVSSATTYLGYNATSAAGTATVSDPSSSWTTTGNMFVGGNASATKGNASVTINDGTVTVGGTLKVYKPSGSVTHTVSLAGGTLTVATLDTNSAPSNFSWTGGTLSFTSTPPDISPAGPLGPTVKLSPSMTLRTTSLPTVASTSTLDISGGALLVAYTGPSPADSLRSLLLAGRISSSAASADPHHPLAIGYSDSASTLTASLTPLGDANLDRVLNADDYTLLDRAFARHVANAHWTDGDFNYDGLVDQQDYLLIDTAYLQQQVGTPSPSFLSQRESQFGDAYVSQLLSSVPEPSSLACLLAALPLLRRNRR